jgi:phosphohistidine phosphatase
VDLYILRHGKAEDPGPGLLDSERNLTKKGREEIAAVARWMVDQEIQIDMIAASPLARAQETAEIVARTLGVRDKVVSWKILAPGGDPETVCIQTSHHPDSDAILLVGHEPLLSSLISRIIAGDRHAGIAMTKGALAKIRHFSGVDRPAGELVWLLTAKQMGGAK